MARAFESFVILADMRTGSNALEERLNDYTGIQCHGEVFNPLFVGHEGQDNLFGMTREARDTDPAAMIAALSKHSSGLAGFRLFSDHDRRALSLVLKDRDCAKIVLTRDPLDSYVSLKIARKTNQWRLGDLSSVRPGKANFDLREFQHFLSARAEWLGAIRRGLQMHGQAAFELTYDDLRDDAVTEGLVRYLGVKSQTAGSSPKGRVQNPVPLAEKVANFADMRRALQTTDPFDFERLPDHEPARGPNVPSFFATRSTGLIYMPIKCAEDTRVLEWLAALDGCEVPALETGFSRKSLRNWKRRHEKHLAFTVVTHPVERAHEAFCRYILTKGPGSFTAIRETLVRTYKVPLPEDPDDEAYDEEAHRAAFLAFLGFLKGNLGGQTAIRVDSAWASQEHSVRGLAEFGMPDAVLRGDRLGPELANFAARAGAEPPALPESSREGRIPLASIYDANVERAARAAYQRDYMMFGFGTWA